MLGSSKTGNYVNRLQKKNVMFCIKVYAVIKLNAVNHTTKIHITFTGDRYTWYL